MNLEELKKRIAGEIALSNNPGSTMKKWRELFGISQAELADYLHITPSTISDYENNRRKSPGIQVIRRFVDALISLDKKKGGFVLQRLSVGSEKGEPAYEIHEFTKPIGAKEFVRAIEGKVITNKRRILNISLHGYTVIDSLKMITSMPVDEFPKIFGKNPRRALIFTQVSIGRSPMVAIRIAPLKPGIVVYQGLSDVRDVVARKISEIERVPIVVTDLDTYEIKMKLKEYEE